MSGESIILPELLLSLNLYMLVGIVTLFGLLFFLSSEYLEGPSYSFSAYWLSNHDANVGDTLIFQNVILNEGSVYNKYTGEYTAKVNGTYAFYSTLCFRGTKYANVRVLADDEVIGAFRVGDKAWNLCDSSSAVAYLAKNSIVKLDVTYTYKTSVFYDESKMHCSFSGHLVKWCNINFTFDFVLKA